MAPRDPKLYFYDTIADRFDELVNAYDLQQLLYKRAARCGPSASTPMNARSLSATRRSIW